MLLDSSKVSPVRSTINRVDSMFRTLKQAVDSKELWKQELDPSNLVPCWGKIIGNLSFAFLIGFSTEETLTVLLSNDRKPYKAQR